MGSAFTLDIQPHSKDNSGSRVDGRSQSSGSRSRDSSSGGSLRKKEREKNEGGA